MTNWLETTTAGPCPICGNQHFGELCPSDPSPPRSDSDRIAALEAEVTELKAIVGKLTWGQHELGS